MKGYIAAPIFNDHQRSVVDLIKVIMERSDIEPFSPYHFSQSIFKGRKPADCSEDERKQVLISNIENVHDCELMVAWVGGDPEKASSTDTGVVWEMGFQAAISGTPAAYGRMPNRRLTIAYIHPDDKRQDMNLMLAGTVDAVCRGEVELEAALSLLQERGVIEVARRFDPDEVLGAEKEPLV